MCENWSFHNHVALPLEMYLRKYAYGHEHDVDRIESGDFVDAMMDVLLALYHDFEGLEHFTIYCREYDNLTASQIPKEDAKALFAMFEELVKVKEKELKQRDI